MHILLMKKIIMGKIFKILSIMICHGVILRVNVRLYELYNKKYGILLCVGKGATVIIKQVSLLGKRGCCTLVLNVFLGNRV